MDIEANKKAKEMIKRFEGLKFQAYYCSANVRTIGWGGWGHVIRSDDNIEDSITLQKAEELLAQEANADNCLFRNALDLHLNHNKKAVSNIYIQSRWCYFSKFIFETKATSQ